MCMISMSEEARVKENERLGLKLQADVMGVFFKKKNKIKSVRVVERNNGKMLGLGLAMMRLGGNKFCMVHE